MCIQEGPAKANAKNLDGSTVILIDLSFKYLEHHSRILAGPPVHITHTVH
jgi:hypothetical protein